MELLMEENPRRRRRYNPMEFDNPWHGDIAGHRAAARKGWRRRRRNPVKNVVARATIREWTQGVDLMDAASAAGGLVAASMIPSAVIKEAKTTTQKLMRLVLGIGSAVGAGAAARAFISPSAGKAAVIGGIGGTTVQAIGMFTKLEIGEIKQISRYARAGTPGRLAAYQPEFQMIKPELY